MSRALHMINSHRCHHYYCTQKYFYILHTMRMILFFSDRFSAYMRTCMFRKYMHAQHSMRAEKIIPIAEIYAGASDRYH